MTATTTATGLAPVVPAGPPLPGRFGRRGVPRTLGCLAAFLIAGNLAIAVASLWARSTTPLAHLDTTGIANFRVVDARLWRGAAPSPEGYAWLAANGVRTVVDLRAEANIDVDHAYLASLGLELIALPIRDGQTPDADQVSRFLAALRDSPGATFVHCGAGVGRTGTMVAAYVKASGGVDPLTAVRRNLAVGPPSVEQLAYAAGVDAGPVQPVLVAVSRTLDAPRRLWTRIRPY